MSETTRAKRRKSRNVVRTGLWVALAIWMVAGTVWMVAASEDGFEIGAGSNPSVAADDHGGVVVTWEGADHDVLVRRVDRGGHPLGDLLRISRNGDHSARPVVTRLASGELVVAWERQDGDDGEIAAALVSTVGKKKLRVEPSELELDGHSPAIGSDDQDRFVVAWTAPAQPGDAAEDRGGNHLHFAQAFNRGGHPLGDLLRLGDRGPDTPPALAVAPAGEFLVAWQDQANDIVAMVSRGGHPLGDLLRINSSRSGHQSSPSATVPLDGEFTVVWERELPETAERRIYGRRISTLGRPLGSEFLVSLSASGQSMEPAVAADAWGRTLVTWTHQDEGGSQIFGRQLDLDGSAFGAVLRIAPPQAMTPQIAPASNDSDFVVVWESSSETALFENEVVGRFVLLGGE